MTDEKTIVTRSLKCGKKTYFFDIKKAENGKKYLVITESKWKGGDDRERHHIIIFEENAENFKTMVSETVATFKEVQ